MRYLHLRRSSSKLKSSRKVKVKSFVELGPISYFVKSDCISDEENSKRSNNVKRCQNNASYYFPLTNPAKKNLLSLRTLMQAYARSGAMSLTLSALSQDLFPSRTYHGIRYFDNHDCA